MDEQQIQTRPRRSRMRAGLIAATLVAGATIGVTLTHLGVAGAQTPTAAPSVPALPGGGHGGGMAFEMHGPGPGFGGGIHGEFTTPAPNGGYETIATQRGTVTSVSASSITVKSEDGFSRDYSVDDNTLVTAGNNGISDVKSGDEVHVVAVVSGGKAHAVEIHDGTSARTLGEKWHPAPPEPAATTTK